MHNLGLTLLKLAAVLRILYVYPIGAKPRYHSINTNMTLHQDQLAKETIDQIPGYIK